MSLYDNPLIFGKDKTENIVSIEIEDGKAVIFQEIDGNVVKSEIQNNPWILCDRDLGGMVRLDGEQHYKYGRQFLTIKEFRDFYNYNFRRSDLYTVHQLKENCMINKGITYFKGMQIQDISVLSFDIETNGLKIDKNSEVYLISNTFCSKNKVQNESKLFSRDDFSSTEEMITAWCEWVRQKDPSIILGHNILGFDFKFLMSFCDLPLGRDGSVVGKNKKESQFRIDGSMSLAYNKLSCYGREIVDTLFLAYRYDLGKKYESYGLKQIVKQEKLEKDGRTFIDASKIYKEWEDLEKRKLIKQYAVEDADDALKLFYLMIPATFYATQMIPKPFEMMTQSATGSQINGMLVRSYLQEKHSIAKTSEVFPYPGSISVGIPGIYKNSIRFDVASLFPSIMLQYNVHSKEKDPKGNMIKILKELRDRRLLHKKLASETGEKFYDSLQLAEKGLINSFYGFMGASGLNYNFVEGAARVTEIGRETLMKAVRIFSGKENLIDEHILKNGGELYVIPKA